MKTDTQEGEPVLAFLRCDKGADPADHHTIVIALAPKFSFGHCAFETLNIDEIAQGQQYLYLKKHHHHWGIGRHILGSQVFDYWKDPWGAEHEHYADGDVFDATNPTRYYKFSLGSLWMWGNDIPARLIDAPPKPEDIQTLDAQTEKKLMAMASVLSIPPRPWLENRKKIK